MKWILNHFHTDLDYNFTDKALKFFVSYILFGIYKYEYLFQKEYIFLNMWYACTWLILITTTTI